MIYSGLAFIAMISATVYPEFIRLMQDITVYSVDLILLRFALRWYHLPLSQPPSCGTRQPYIKGEYEASPFVNLSL